MMNHLKIFFLSIFLLSGLIINTTQATESKDFKGDNNPISKLLKVNNSEPVDQSLLNEALSIHPVTFSWGDIFKILGKNTLQIVNVCDCIRAFGMEPLPSRSRSDNRIVQYVENRIGYGIAPFNFMFNWQPIKEEGPTSMLIRGLCKKYNVEILRHKLVEEYTAKSLIRHKYSSLNN